MKKLLIFSVLSIPALLLHASCGSDDIDHSKLSLEESIDLCEDVVDHTQPCCDLTSEQVEFGKGVCQSSTFSDEQIQLLECTLVSSCDGLLNNDACGGLVCMN